MLPPVSCGTFAIMAASRAPHPLAEAVCELAAPPLQPTFLKLFLTHNRSDHEEHNYKATLALLLHVRPRLHGSRRQLCPISGGHLQCYLRRVFLQPAAAAPVRWLGGQLAVGQAGPVCAGLREGSGAR